MKKAGVPRMLGINVGASTIETAEKFKKDHDDKKITHADRSGNDSSTNSVIKASEEKVTPNPIATFKPEELEQDIP